MYMDDNSVKMNAWMNATMISMKFRNNANREITGAITMLWKIKIRPNKLRRIM
ncbi:hypothetical protein D3C87_2076670 [compost metagenome]